MLLNNNSLNLNKLYEMKYKTFSKFDNLKKFSNKDTYIHNLDRYILHTLEEMAEVQLDEDDREESIDVLLYLGTIYSFISKTLENSYDVYSSKFNKVTIIDVNYKEDEQEIMNNIFIKLMQIRRKFPERKWHKNITVDSEKHKERLIESKELLEECITLISMIIKNKCEDENEFNQLIEEKHNKLH